MSIYFHRFRSVKRFQWIYFFLVPRSIAGDHMGLYESLKQLLGIGAESAATRGADPEDLFGMSTAYVTMEGQLGYVPAGLAGLCFAAVDSTDFKAAVDEVREILTLGEPGAVANFREDEFGYRWIVLEASDFEDLVTAVHFASDTLIERRYGSRLQAAVFAFEATEVASQSSGEFVYWIYSFRRGAFYPFVPRPDRSRATQTEYKLASVLDGELDVEDDRQYWYPLWPDDSNSHPWQ